MTVAGDLGLKTSVQGANRPYMRPRLVSRAKSVHPNLPCSLAMSFVPLDCWADGLTVGVFAEGYVLAVTCWFTDWGSSPQGNDGVQSGWGNEEGVRGS